MIKSPYTFESAISDKEFQKIGEFACRWSMIEHTMANCLRAALGMEPGEATIMIFPLSLDQRMQKLRELKSMNIFTPYQQALLAELKPLILAMQYIRNTVLHGTAMDLNFKDEMEWHLRSKGRVLKKSDLFACEDLINYTGHVSREFRMAMGDKLNAPWAPPAALPCRPPIPPFLPKECQARLPADMEALITRQQASFP
jgi:hypothetical protein